MKRTGNIYQQIYDYDNLLLADKSAQKGKRKKRAVIKHMERQEEDLLCLQQSLMNCSYKTSKYSYFKLNDGKERDISCLPYFPDHVFQHALIQVIKPILSSTFTRDTYSCIKGRGLHAAVRQIKTYLTDRNDTTYYLKMDIRKFYPSINHDVLKSLLRKKIKDWRVLAALDELIDSAPGLPLGNYSSQPLGNFYLTYFDHFVKEQLRVRKYIRYCDDLLFFSKSKEELHEIIKKVSTYLGQKLGLEVNSNWRVAPVETGLDILGYVFRHNYVLLRKKIKDRYVRMMKYHRNQKSIGAYNGWLLHCDSKNLQRKMAA